MAKEYGVNASSLYERMRRIGLDVSSAMGTTRKVFSHYFVREIYEEARSTKKSVTQVLRERDLAERAGGIAISGRAMGLVPLSPSEITGHSERDTYLYIMKVTICEGIVELAGFDQGRDDGPVLGATIGAGEQRVFGIERDEADRRGFEGRTLDQRFQVSKVGVAQPLSPVKIALVGDDLGLGAE